MSRHVSHQCKDSFLLEDMLGDTTASTTSTVKQDVRVKDKECAGASHVVTALV
jgi:hypothetical protein